MANDQVIIQAPTTKIMMWAIGLIVTINIAATTFLAGHLITLYVDVASIKASRFTAKDGSEMLKLIHEMKSTFVTALPKEIPPIWWKEEVKSRFLRLETSMDKMGVRTERLESDARKQG